MKKGKISLKNISGKLSRNEMKNITAGAVAIAGCPPSTCDTSCTIGKLSGTCRWNSSQTTCYCAGASS